MFIIESSRGNKKWISAVFEKIEKAEEHLQLLTSSNAEHKLITTDLISYPIFIIEDLSSTIRFTYVSKADAMKRVKSIEMVDDEDVVYFNIFEIYEDYISEVIGEDWMGNIQHSHIDNHFLTYSKDFK